MTDRARRAELIGLYALNLELARTSASVSSPLMGEIRLEWWREGVEEVAAGRPARSPALDALNRAASEGRLDRSALDRMISARRQDLTPTPFPDEPALERYLDDTAGAVMLAAARLLAPDTPVEAVRGAGRAWGWASWMRAKPAVDAAGRRWSPVSWGESTTDELTRHAAHRIDAALTQARGELQSLPIAGFPAVSYASLARSAAAGPLRKRARLTWATLRGRF